MSIRRAAASVLALAAMSATVGSRPDIDTALVSGLEREVRVVVDEWGVSHIYADRLYDVFTAQGFVAARDRLWQIDLWRKRGLGEMAKDFGPAYVEGDRMARAVLFRGNLYREWLAYGSDAKRVAEAFVAGVNAFVALTERQPDLLPEEFRLLGYRPSRWQAADIVRIRHHGLTGNLSSEVDRAELHCRAGSDASRADWLRRELVPETVPAVPSGLDPCALPFDALREAYSLATARPVFPDATRAAGLRASTDQMAGSNNWVIAPSRSETGRAVLASDPHRAHGAPSLRYITHLVAPGLDVIGAGEPFLPGISIGHNGAIAFGLTRFYIDQEDLYFYELNPANPGEYRHKGRWERFESVTERIEVRGESPREVTLHFSRHGPVLAVDKQARRAFALRAAWLDVGMAPYFGAIDYMRARNWDQFAAAMNRWGAPGENQVYADADGNIGWIPAGLTPIRPNWDGLMPVPGDGRYEWDGYRDMDELPRTFNPREGLVITANENNIPPDHPAAGKGIGYEWSDDSRARRLRQLAASKERYSFEDSKAWQLDTTSLPAQRVVRLLNGLSSPDASVARALDTLRAWNGDVSADSAAAAIFEVWLSNHLRRAVLEAVLGPDVAALIGRGDVSRILRVLEGHGQWLPRDRRDAVLLASLASAVRDLQGRLGPDPRTWQWGALHRAVFVHPLAARVDEATRSRLNVGPWPLGGSAHTPMAAGYSFTDFHLSSGASFRMVVDVGRWDNSVAINTPGQSGDPASRHYRDLAPLWAEGRYFPLAYSRSAVESHERTRLVLMPGP
jgi:penicillin amidase